MSDNAEWAEERRGLKDRIKDLQKTQYDWQKVADERLQRALVAEARIQELEGELQKQGEAWSARVERDAALLDELARRVKQEERFKWAANKRADDLESRLKAAGEEVLKVPCSGDHPGPCRDYHEYTLNKLREMDRALTPAAGESGEGSVRKTRYFHAADRGTDSECTDRKCREIHYRSDDDPGYPAPSGNQRGDEEKHPDNCACGIIGCAQPDWTGQPEGTE